MPLRAAQAHSHRKMKLPMNVQMTKLNSLMQFYVEGVDCIFGTVDPYTYVWLHIQVFIDTYVIYEHSTVTKNITASHVNMRFMFVPNKAQVSHSPCFRAILVFETVIFLVHIFISFSSVKSCEAVCVPSNGTEDKKQLLAIKPLFEV